ncbi:MAG: NTP transferase domain-containing protein [bacterium]|nr:NTP transferase domain-containing protein [bacterium]
MENFEKVGISLLSRGGSDQILLAGITAGGRSQRMGFDKFELAYNGVRIVVRLANTVRQYAKEVVLLGDRAPGGQFERTLPDAPDARGPVAGVLAAMRWAPQAAWLFLACDMPLMSAAALQWLISQREPGVWAVIPRDRDGLHPLGAIYEPNMRDVFETHVKQGNFSLHHAAQHPKTKIVDIPNQFRDSWTNCNTEEEWKIAKEKLIAQYTSR